MVVMPKRRNPFGDCSPLQLKQHVGIKELDLGVAQEQKMKHVYDRTRELLFSGSKRSFDVPKDANCNEIYSTLTSSSEEVMMEEDMPVCNDIQMNITTTGHLKKPETVTTDKPKNAFEALMMSRKVNSASSCQCCRGQAASQDRCGFCERSICYDCVRSCSSCDGQFCQLCSVMSYEDVSEHAYCLQCAS